ncbi:MAG: polysaccharide biosynthesis C-terminal domain-containing protein [Candidatus Azobacteroides sp.]|nr:polysaccharide biosynthesis C-terminal domain-containing protein [Candidatus Azobacteroides sp.]
MGIFQFTATQSRPLILSIFSNEGAGILADYRVIEVFPIFIISLGGMLISILLPKTSQAVQQNDQITIERIAYQGTKYTSILVSSLCFPIILNAADLLTLYVGESYKHLAIWLGLWVFTLTLFLHNTPVASLILATGKTKMLVYSSAIACIVSVLINAILCNNFGVGSAVIGYLVYIIIQLLFYYLYINNKILNLNSFKIFKNFIFPTFLGIIIAIPIHFITFCKEYSVIGIIIKTIIWLFSYYMLLFFTNTVDKKKITSIIKKKLSK